jgi:hypothetical protein
VRGANAFRELVVKVGGTLIVEAELPDSVE